MQEEEIKRLFGTYTKKPSQEKELGLQQPRTLLQELLSHPDLEKDDFQNICNSEVSFELLVQGIYDNQFNRREKLVVEQLLGKNGFEKRLNGAYYKDGKFVGYLLDFC